MILFTDKHIKKGSHIYLQIIKHISHVAAVIQGISIGAFSFRNLTLALQNISKVTPCCQEKKIVLRRSCSPIIHNLMSELGVLMTRKSTQPLL